MSHFLTESFDPTQVDPTQGSGGWPLGRHPVVATAVEVKATKGNENNGMASFTLEIIDGPEKGYKGFWNLNLYHESEKARNFARRDLSAMCHVTQTFRLGQQGNDLSQLFNKPFVVDVGYQKGDGPVGPENPDNKGYTEIKKLYDINGNEPGKSGQSNNAQAPQQNNGGSNSGNGGGWGNNSGNANQNQGNNGGGNGGGWGNVNQGNGNNQGQDNNQQAQAGGGWNGNSNNGNSNNDQGNNGGNGGWTQNNGNNGGGNTPSWGARN